MKSTLAAFVAAVVVALVGATKSPTEESTVAMLDWCRACAGDPGADCAGCPSDEKPADDALLALFSANAAELLAQAQEMVTRQGINAALLEIVPIRYSKQVVAGTNWFVKVQFHSDLFADVAIFEPLAFRHQPPEIFGIKFDVERDAPISFINFPNLISLIVERSEESTAAMLDWCANCAGDDGDDCSGCPSDEKPADDAVLALFSANAEFQAQAQEMATREGINADFPEFVPIRYKKQAGAGTYWFVKVQLDSGVFADVAIFEPLLFTLRFEYQGPAIFDMKFGVERNAPISLPSFLPSHMNPTLMV